MELAARRTRNPAMVVQYQDELRLFASPLARTGVAMLGLAWLLLPLNLTDYPLVVLSYAGAAAIGAIGLNLLTGYTGQVSLGHAFFTGAGAYTCAYLGAQRGLPVVVWLPAAAAIGCITGAAIGPFALRLRGNYLVVITLGLVLLGEHVFKNWDSVTGGGNGTSTTGALGTLDASHFTLFGSAYTREQGFFWLIWAVVALGALLAKNIVRSRPGRAMQAIRDGDLAAEVIGVSQARYKVGAFVVSSGYAAVGGALYAVLQGRLDPTQFGLVLGIQFVAIVIVGGLGTIFGSIVGAIVLGGLPRVIEALTRDNDLPFVSGDRGGPEGFLTVASLNKSLYGAIIIAFLIAEPRGLAGVWLRMCNWFKTWPFSYQHEQ